MIRTRISRKSTVSSKSITTPDPSDAAGSPFDAPNRYLMATYLDFILPRKDPDLSVIWLRNPDATQHLYGVGSPNALEGVGPASSTPPLGVAARRHAAGRG